jgi:hypothetical protein
LCIAVETWTPERHGSSPKTADSATKPSGAADDGNHPPKRKGHASFVAQDPGSRPRGLRSRQVHHTLQVRDALKGTPLPSRSRLHRRRPRLGRVNEGEGKELRHRRSGSRHERGPPRGRQPGDGPGVELAQQPAPRPQLLPTDPPSSRSWLGWNGCRPLRCTITGSAPSAAQGTRRGPATPGCPMRRAGRRGLGLRRCSRGTRYSPGPHRSPCSS